LTLPGGCRIMHRVRGVAPIALLFALSGALGLIYEVAWTRFMVLMVGASTPAVAIVLGVFMAGLAVGARIFGPLADRHPAPLRLYGVLEAGIGAYALALPVLVAWATPAYVHAAHGLQGQPMLLGLVRCASGLALLGLPTALMGGTLPVLLRAVARGPAGLGNALGRLYGANLLGAVAGSLSSAFVLVGALGLRGTVTAAALGNLAIALVAVLWPKQASEPTPVAPRAAAPQAGAGLPLAIAFLSGVLTLGYEVLWTRILVFSFLSTVPAFAVILATVLCGLTLGSAAFAWAERRWPLGIATLGVVQVGAGLLAMGLAPVGARAEAMILALSQRLGFTGTTYVLAMAATSALLLLLPATLMGVVFPLASRVALGDASHPGEDMGRAYWLNTFGAVIGSVLTGFVLVPSLGLKGGLVLLTGVQVLAGCVCLLSSPGGRARPVAVGLGSAAAFAAVLALVSRALAGPNPFDPSPGGTLLAHRDDATASVSVVARPWGGRSLRIDGFEAAAADERSGYMAMMAHIPLLLHPRPERALVVCFGTGTTAGAVLRHAGVSLDVVDINRTVFSFADYFRESNHGVAADPRARLIVDDGRGYLLTTAASYDVITAEPMPPTFAGVASLYSREYYERARERLRPGGLVVQWLPFHLITTRQAWSILRSVVDVFPQTTLWVHDGTGIIVASRDRPIVLDAPLLRPRLAALGDELRHLGVKDLSGFAELYGLGPSMVASFAAQAPPVTDDRPSLEFSAPRHRAEEHRGAFTPEQMQALLAVYTARARETVPLAGATSNEAAEIAASRVPGSHALCGDVYLGAGFNADARREYEEGLAAATITSQRALLLFALAQVAEKDGAPAEALRLVERGLALWPDNSAAVRLRDRLAAVSP
jgi:spermidine synthase